MDGPTSLHKRLQRATEVAHRALEQTLDVVERLSQLPDRRLLVLRYFRMHASADMALAPWLEPIADLDHPSRRRSLDLMADITALGAALPDRSDLPEVAVGGRAEALGFLYVLEGSALGGRMIHRTLAAKGCGLTGLGFLDPYGARTGEQWRGFLAVMEREGAADPEAVERGGVRGFEHARACLAPVGAGA